MDYNVGPFLFNDGHYFIWAVFRVLEKYENAPSMVRYLGTVRVRMGRLVSDAIKKQFPAGEYIHKIAWRSQVNHWRARHPHKTLYKAPYPLNRALCKKCGEVVESTYTHHYVRCSCGAIAVDGGYDYFKRAGELKDVEEMP